MPDTVEKKTYLVNIENNLDKYAKDAAEAKKRVDELTLANMKMQASDKASAEEKEKSSAALKAAQAEYRTAQTLLTNFNKALNSETNSRKQLNEVLKLQQFELGKLGDGYIKDEKGILRVNPLYVEQTKKVRETKEAIILLDKAQLDGRSSVGLYSEAIEGALGRFKVLPGPVGAASKSVIGFTNASKAMLASPIAIVITVIVKALALLIKAFKGNDEASEKFSGILKGLGVVIKEVLSRVISLGQAVVHLFKGEFKEAADSAKEAFVGFGKSVSDAFKGGVEQQKLMNKIEDAEIATLEKIAERNKEIAQLKKNSRNMTEEAWERSNDLLKAEQLEKENNEDLLAIQRDRVKLAEMELANTNKNQVTDEQRMKVAQERAKLLDMETQSIDRQTAIQRRRIMVENEIAAAIKERQAEMEKAKNVLTKEIEDYRKFIADKQRADLDADQKKKEGIIAQQEWEKERDLINQENLLAIREANNEDVFNLERARLEQEHQMAVNNAIKTGADVSIIDGKYKAAQRVIDEAEQTAKLGLYSDFAGNLAIIFGKNTAIGKAAAVAQTAIATYTSATEAFKALAGIPVVGPALGAVAAAAAIASGLANVKKILAVKSGLPGDSGAGSASIPTSISSAPAAQRSFASGVGATFFTQPQLSQSQLNTLPNENLLTADQIAEAIKKLPAPVVTVEDINARQAEVTKVSVRANI